MKNYIDFLGSQQIDCRCHPTKIKKPTTTSADGWDWYCLYIKDPDDGKYTDFNYRPYGPSLIHNSGQESNYGWHEHEGAKGVENKMEVVIALYRKKRKYYQYYYYGCCVHMNPQDIEEMVDNAREITWRTFRSKVYKQDIEKLCKDLGYNSKIKIHEDPYVRLYRSKFTVMRDIPVLAFEMTCYFLSHSAIEYVFTPYEYTL